MWNSQVEEEKLSWDFGKEFPEKLQLPLDRWELSQARLEHPGITGSVPAHGTGREWDGI